MARPTKKGLDYFPKDTDYYYDYKIMDLLNEYGPVGQTIYDIVITLIYREGYYLAITLDKLAITVLRIIGNRWTKKDFVLQVILYCADIGLLDNDLLQQNVITSVGLQQRYAKVTVRNKVNKDKFWLLDDEQPLISVSENRVIVTETPVTATETGVIVTETPINKRKENINIYAKLILDNGSYHNVTYDDVSHYKELYPNINVEQELRNMQGWLEANTAKRKTNKGIKRFINSWLLRCTPQKKEVEHNWLN